MCLLLCVTVFLTCQTLYSSVEVCVKVCRCIVVSDAKISSRVALLIDHSVSSARTLKHAVTLGYLMRALSERYKVRNAERVRAPPPIQHLIVIDESGVLSEFRVCFVGGYPIIYRYVEVRANAFTSDGCVLHRLAAALHSLYISDGYFGVIHSPNSTLNQCGLKPVAIKKIPWLNQEVAYYTVSDLPKPSIVATLSFEEAYKLAREAKEARRRSRVKIYPSGVSNA